MRIVLLLFLALTSTVLLQIPFATGAKAQTPAPPDLQCLLGDVLTWEDPTDACGALESIDIFGAATANGPFELVENVAAGEGELLLSPTQLGRYEAYYLIGVYACSPARSATSDTITTEPLAVTRIRDIERTVDGTILNWDFPDDPRVTGFLIYKETATGTELLDTVTATTYVDAGTAVEPNGAIYYLGTIDDCEGSSFGDLQFSSIGLRADRDGCNATITLTPELEAAWPFDFTQAVVVRRTFRGTVDTINVPYTTGSFELTDLPPDTAYTVRVTLLDADGGTNTSFPIDLSAQDVVSDDLIEIVQLTFENDSWGMRWRWNPAAQYENIRFRVVQGGREVVNEMADPGLKDSPAPLVDLGLDAGFDWTTATATVTATDICGVERSSEPARAPTVTASEIDGIRVATAWTLPFAPSIISNSWDLRLLDEIGSQSVFTSSSETEFVHDVSAVNVRQVCYQLVVDVVAPAVFERGEASYTWRSAPGCTLRSPRVFLPTGYIPEGFTIGYRPQLSLVEGLVYRFRIFDRWGRTLFDTTDRFETWEGRVAGTKRAPPGTYLAVVELEEPGRDPIRVESQFALIR